MGRLREGENDTAIGVDELKVVNENEFLLRLAVDCNTAGIVKEKKKK